MIDDRIGYRYAKSLFDLAKEKNLLEEVKVDMELIHLTSVQSRDFRSMLNSPLISPKKKRTILQAIFKDKFDTDFTKLLVEIMVRKGRERYIDNAAKAFLQLYDLEKHIQRGKLISAMPLTDAQIAEIRKEVEKETGDDFEMDVEIDPALIGGFVLKIGDQLFDGSIASSLRKLEQEFQTNTYIKQF
jgi:F-type H+-transporting ATPase subunit delta